VQRSAALRTCIAEIEMSPRTLDQLLLVHAVPRLCTAIELSSAEQLSIDRTRDRDSSQPRHFFGAHDFPSRIASSCDK
jgi:hypothetical protein